MTVPQAPNDEGKPSASDRFLVSEATAAELLSISLPTFRRWVSDGLILPVALPRATRRKLYRRADLEAFAAGLAPSS